MSHLELAVELVWCSAWLDFELCRWKGRRGKAPRFLAFQSLRLRQRPPVPLAIPVQFGATADRGAPSARQRG